LDLVPIQEPDTKTRCLLVAFLPLTLSPESLPTQVSESETDARIIALGKRLQELERELGSTKEYLQSTVEDKESANEELKSSNEELQSANEELQSTNEELETSREEMQSSNEELTTVNEELQNRMGELSQTNDDLHNVLAGLDNPVIIVGMDFRIRRYTASAERLLNLVPGDMGRSISLMDSFCGKDIQAKVSQVIDRLASVEEEVLCRNQRWYALRVSPYKTLDHAIRGAVVSLIDIDVRKRSAALMRDVGEYATRFLGAIHHPLLMLDGRVRIVWANQPYFDFFGVIPEETIGNSFPTPADPVWAHSHVRERLEQTLRTGEAFRDHAVSLNAGESSNQSVRVGASLVPVASDSTLLLVSIERGG
ncbi:MAG TPA: PAS domain-containing protein, partial [Candidatus Polarisedimenticolia bacterium]|nr:PAS domain-containing protein [Candidatus Polarisedimenticolia bacterium]